MLGFSSVTECYERSKDTLTLRTVLSQACEFNTGFCAGTQRESASQHVEKLGWSIWWKGAAELLQLAPRVLLLAHRGENIVTHILHTKRENIVSHILEHSSFGAYSILSIDKVPTMNYAGLSG